jgi:hypothetical protein
MLRVRNTLFALAAFALIPNSANAELVYNFGQNGVVGGTEFMANAGDSITLEIYLTQTGTFDVFGTAVSDFRLSNNPGAFGLGADDFNFAVGTGAETDVVPRDIGAGFNFGTGLLDDGTSGRSGSSGIRAAFFASQDNNVSITPVFAAAVGTPMGFQSNNLPIGENSILLAEVTLDIGIGAAGPFNLSTSAGGVGALIGNSILAGPFVVPSNGMATLNVTAVPEPSTWALLGLGTLVVARRHRKKSKAKKTAVA